jgi:hypothetical protein
MALIPFQPAHGGDQDPTVSRGRSHGLRKIGAVRDHDESIAGQSQLTAVEIDLKFRDRDQPSSARQKRAQRGSLCAAQELPRPRGVSAAVEGEDEGKPPASCRPHRVRRDEGVVRLDVDDVPAILDDASPKRGSKVEV